MKKMVFDTMDASKAMKVTHPLVKHQLEQLEKSDPAIEKRHRMYLDNTGKTKEKYSMDIYSFIKLCISLGGKTVSSVAEQHSMKTVLLRIKEPIEKLIVSPELHDVNVGILIFDFADIAVRNGRKDAREIAFHCIKMKFPLLFYVRHTHAEANEIIERHLDKIKYYGDAIEQELAQKMLENMKDETAFDLESTEKELASIAVEGITDGAEKIRTK